MVVVVYENEENSCVVGVVLGFDSSSIYLASEVIKYFIHGIIIQLTVGLQ